MDRKRLAAAGLIIVLSASAAACGPQEETAEAEKVTVEVQNPHMGDLSVDTAYVGAITPQEQVYVLPMVSGTVTETFYAVGDMVSEGDVLFKIDDKAYRLQLKNAQAAYSSAQAGVAAQSGGARHLQNYQTEQQIQQLKDSLGDTYADLDDLEEQKEDIEKAEDSLPAALQNAQSGLAALTAAYRTKEIELTPLISQAKTGIEAKQGEISAKNAAIAAAKNNGSDTAALETELTKLQQELGVLTGQLNQYNMQLSSYESSVNQAKSAVTSLQTQMAGLGSGKAQIESGIEQLEAGQDTIRKNLAAAEGAYSITQKEVYPQADAASAAQLGQAAAGIDSAKLQVDYCTVTAPVGGIVEAVNIEKNGMAAAGNPAYIISNKESMTVTFHVAEKAKNALAVGDHVTVTHHDAEYDAVITEIGTMAGLQTRLFQVKASVSGAGDALPSGISVKVNAVTKKESGKLLIPYDALYFSGGDAYVYCVEGSAAIKTFVTVGLMSDAQAVIEEGLTEESQVVTSWSSRLRDRAQIVIASDNQETPTAPEEANQAEEAQ